MERRSLILDTGALIALARGNRRVRGLFTLAQQQAVRIIVPPAVVTQTVRGSVGDAMVNHILHSVWVSFVGKRVAMAAGALLGQAGMSDAADAQVMAEAIRSGPSILLTSDPDDMTRLANGRRSVEIVRV